MEAVSGEWGWGLFFRDAIRGEGHGLPEELQLG